MLLLLMLVACTEDAAEVNNLVRQDEYVSVRMQVPGMKAAATRAEAEDNVTSVWALTYHEGVLKTKTEVTTAASTLNPATSTTGTFNIPRPASGDVIHFLANVPSDVTLPDVGSEESALSGLTTENFSSLSYWGKATYTSDESIDVILYRNMAKVEIAAGKDCTFPEDRLFIAGLVKPIEKGTLVPYQDGFNFDLNEHDYYTLPSDLSEPADRTNNQLPEHVKSLYLFEHDNLGTANGLYIICEIDEEFYKVALIDENGDPYPIIRNHRYVIYVNDLDYGADSFDAAAASDPVNFVVREYKDVTLTLASEASTLYYNSTSDEAVTVTVGGINSAVETLTLTAPGFTILSDYAKDEGNGVFRITDRTKEEINFTLTLTDPAQAGTVSVTAAGEFVNGGTSNMATATITLSERAANSGEIIMWQGAVEMHNNNNDGTTHAGKVLIPYSFFFDANGTQKILADSKISLEYNNTGYIQTYLFKDGEASIWNISESTELTLTQELLNKIKESHTTVWGVDAAFVFEGGGGAVLKKVTLIPAKESIVATADKTQLYYDSDEPQVVTVNVTVPNGVETLNISAPDFSFGGDSDGDYTHAVNGQNISLQFTMKSGITEAKKSTITFSGGENVNAAEVTINLVATQSVTFSYTGSTTINLNDGYLDVQMNGMPDGGTVTLNFDAAGFTVSAQNGSTLTQNGNVWTYTGGATNFRFTPTAPGEKTITITGTGTNISVAETAINVTVNAAITATATPSTIYFDGTDKTVTVSVTIPKGVSGLNIAAADFNYGDDTDGLYTYERTDGATSAATVDLTFTLKDDVAAAKTSTITISDASGNTCVSSAEVSVSVEATPAQTNALTVTPLSSTTIDLSGSGNNTIQLRLAIPADLNYLRINTDYAFTVSALNGYTQPRSQAPDYYYDYITPGSVSTIDLEFTMSADYIFEVAGEYPITFYAAQNSSEGITTTITVVNENLDDGVIWEGSKTATNSGYILKYTSFSEYRGSGKKLKIDVTSTSGGWKQFSIKYEGDNNNNLGALQGNTIDSTLSIDIPADDRDIVISGQGGITITKIYVE